MRSSLSEMGVALTRKRVKALEALASSDHHPSARELHAEVRRIYPSTSLATIYNTIELLKEAGQIMELEFSGSANRYDGRRPDSHPHLICLECRSVEDMDVGGWSEVSLNHLSEATGYKLVRQRADYYGLCPTCQDESEDQRSEARPAAQQPSI